MASGDIPKVTPLEGKTTVDDKMIFEQERLSYLSADSLAEKIAYAIKIDVEKKNVVIVGTAFLVDLSNLQAVGIMLDQLKSDYDALSKHAGALARRQAGQQPPAIADLIKTTLGVQEMSVGVDAMTFVGPAAAVAGVSAVLGTTLGTALGFVSLFREDVDYRGSQTVVNPLAFELALAAKIKSKGAEKVFVPDLTVMPTPQSGPDSLRSRLAAVQKAKAQVWEIIGPFVSELMRLDTELDQAMRNREALRDQATKDENQARVDDLSRQLAARRKDLDPVTELLGQLDQQLTDLQTEWNKKDEATGLMMLARWLRAESIRAMNPIYLHAQVVSSGGHSRIIRSLWRTMFTGDGLSFMGGAIVRWALLEGNGSIMKGGIESEHKQG